MTSIGMVVSLINEGAGSIVSPYLLSLVVGAQPVETYLFMSLVASSICLAFTCIIIYRKQPPDPEIVQLLLTLVGKLGYLKAKSGKLNK